ncbi:methionyl-tRNA formyltransferase [Telmatospirillum sp.]|uniref:methionyl-tRNA formyltransferase n=1 Tax=Telmatospirillum sp. TaxID=2079197 RepID=UPI0028420622|nr:methionyl-tRNA formyltransferase [Telmatospirillum sp.]MDR3439192.1 methionyl-tRNA formyltransferase [Telmatospirillum sp.]
MRIVFMGTPDFSVPILSALQEAGHQVCSVYSQPPRPAGRGHMARPSPVHAFAESLGIEVRTPKSLRNAEAQAAFCALRADVAVVAAYGLILPKAILEAPRFGCLNVHASLLPRWRGAAPIQRAILAGDAVTGVTIMQMDEGLDTGAMLLGGQVPISSATDATSLHDDLSAMGASLIVEALARLSAGSLTATPQPLDGVTYAAKLAKDEGRLDWNRPAALLERAVRAYTPWPGAWFDHAGERFKVLAATVVDGHGVPGTVLDHHLTVACGEKALRVVRLQRSGKAAMDTDAFLRGYSLVPGTQLIGPCPVTN